MTAKELYIQLLGNLDINDYLNDFPIDGEDEALMHQQNVAKMEKWAKTEFDRGVLYQKMKQIKEQQAKEKAAATAAKLVEPCIYCAKPLYLPCGRCGACTACCNCKWAVST